LHRTTVFTGSAFLCNAIYETGRGYFSLLA
jgi:hypothetical protein